MAILSEKLSRYKAVITVNSSAVNPAFSDLSDDDSPFQAVLDSERTASEVLGMDYLMFAEGGIFSEHKDLKKASGIFNLAQSVTHRLMTWRGTMPEDPYFGVPWGAYLGKTYKSRGVIINSLSEDVSDEVLKDARVADILNIEVEFLDPNTVTVDLTILPIYTSLGDSINILITAGV